MFKISLYLYYQFLQFLQFNFFTFSFFIFFLQGIDLDVIPTTEIITSSSIDRRALDDSNVPKGFTILGLTKVGDTNFTLRPVNIGSYYRIKVAAYNRAGPGSFSAAIILGVGAIGATSSSGQGTPGTFSAPLQPRCTQRAGLK